MSHINNISCDEALQHLFAYLDRELDERSRGEMEQHLHRCRSCYSRAEFEKRLKERLRATGHDELPATLAARVQKIVGSF